MYTREQNATRALVSRCRVKLCEILLELTARVILCKVRYVRKERIASRVPFFYQTKYIRIYKLLVYMCVYMCVPTLTDCDNRPSREIGIPVGFGSDLFV